MKLRKVGITGATGFIGKNLISNLSPQKFEVIKYRGDLIKGDGIREFTEGLDVLIHLAGRVMPPDEKIFEENIISTYNLLTSLDRPLKFIFNSSAAVYGSERSGHKFTEVDKIHPDTVYGLSKSICETMIKTTIERIGGKYVILRPFNVYGPGNFKGVIFDFYKSIKSSGKVVINGDGKQERNFLYVKDAIEAIIKAMDLNDSGVFNLGTKENHTLIDLVDMFKVTLKKYFKVQFKEDDDTKTGTIKIDSKLAKRLLRWQPQVALNEGLRDTIDWYEKNTSDLSL